MKCSAFIATSVDGYIATVDGGVEWLEEIGSPGDSGFTHYIESVDCMVMGRKCLEKIASFRLTPEEWPYGDIPIYALSKTMREPPEDLVGNVEMYSGDVAALVKMIEKKGFKHVYVDGGTTITSFLQLGLLNEICVTQVPVLLGDGLPLFGKIGKTTKLSQAEAKVLSNEFIQWRYNIG